jgi:hypothetical protein
MEHKHPSVHLAGSPPDSTFIKKESGGCLHLVAECQTDFSNETDPRSSFQVIQCYETSFSLLGAENVLLSHC